MSDELSPREKIWLIVGLILAVGVALWLQHLINIGILCACHGFLGVCICA